jgi:type IV pilus assembly protein PilV
MINFSVHPINKSSQKGVMFIEVLIAVFILTTGILGAAAMQASAKKASFDAMQRSLASSLAQDIIERMRANDVASLENYQGTNYGDSLNAKPDEAGRCRQANSQCDANTILNNDLYEWELALMGEDVTNNGATGGLVDGIGCINVNGNRVRVTISWQGKVKLSDAVYSSSGVNCGKSGNKRRQVVINAFII